jgi:hypothetical protein
MESFTNDSTKHLHNRHLHDKLNEEYLLQSSEELYKHIVRSIHTTARETLGEGDQNYYRRRNAFWWNQELEEQKKKKFKCMRNG